MTDPDESVKWTVVFDNGPQSEVFIGTADTYAEAYSAVLQQARFVRELREADLMPYCIISVGPMQEAEVGVWLPMTDLSLDDHALIERIGTETATEHHRREQHEALLRTGAPSCRRP